MAQLLAIKYNSLSSAKITGCSKYSTRSPITSARACEPKFDNDNKAFPMNHFISLIEAFGDR